MENKPYDSNYVPTQSGIFDLSWDDYRRIRALNNSGLKWLQYSPLHYKTNVLDAPPEKPTYNMMVGSAFHFLALQPDRYPHEVVTDPGWNKNSNKYKDWAAGHKDKLILKAKDIANVRNMVRIMHEKESLKDLLSTGWPERVILWQDPDFGFWCKGMIDWLTTGPVIVDLKKFSSQASQWNWTGQIRRYDYYSQAWFYQRGLLAATGHHALDFIWIVSESDPPNECRGIVVDPDEVDKQCEEKMHLVELYANCLEKDEWPGYSDELLFLGYRDNAYEIWGKQITLETINSEKINF
jgi:hypothetical protein